MEVIMQKLNTTGNFWKNSEGDYFSYNTQLTSNYKGLTVFNNTFYSMTTRKHQAYFRNDKFDLILTTCQYSTRLQPDEVEEAIQTEIANIDWQSCQLLDKRNTQKKKETIKQLNSRKEFLINVLNK